MNNLATKLHHRMHRKMRVRSTIIGTAERPRLTVFISNLHVSAQVIDDSSHATLAHVTTIGSKSAKGTKTELASWVGTEIAKKCKVKKINSVVFDRNGKLYHGRVKALADAAREAGLEF